MNRVLLIVVIAVLVGLAAWFGISRDNNTNKSNMDMNKSTSTNQSQQKAEPVAADKVSIRDFAFTPADITVKKGTAVTWTNDDTVAHTVTENDGQDGPASSELAPGKTYSFTFSKAGTFKYHCSLHPQMTGTVAVTE